MSIHWIQRGEKKKLITTRTHRHAHESTMYIYSIARSSGDNSRTETKINSNAVHFLRLLPTLVRRSHDFLSLSLFSSQALFHSFTLNTFISTSRDVYCCWQCQMSARARNCTRMPFQFHSFRSEDLSVSLFNFLLMQMLLVLNFVFAELSRENNVGRPNFITVLFRYGVKIHA